MATPAELLRDAGLTDDEIAATLGSFSADPRVAKAFEQGTLRQSDYSRNMDALKVKQSTLEANWQTANAEYVKMQTSLQTTQAEKDEAARKLAEAESKLAAAPTFDATKVVTPEAMQQQFQRYAAGQTAYLGEVMDITDEHQQLFGKRISPNQLMKEATAAGKSPVDYWNEKYDVPKKREEVATAAQDARDSSIREEERKKVLAEMLTPGSRPLRDSDRPFYEPQNSGADYKNPWDETGPSEEEKNLVASLAEAGR